MYVLAVERTCVKLQYNAVLYHMHQPEIKISTTDNNLVCQDEREDGIGPNTLEIVAGDSVKVITGFYIGQYAMVLGDRYGSEVEMQYFIEKKGGSSGKYWVSER